MCLIICQSKGSIKEYIYICIYDKNLKIKVRSQWMSTKGINISYIQHCSY